MLIEQSNFEEVLLDNNAVGVIDNVELSRFGGNFTIYIRIVTGAHTGKVISDMLSYLKEDRLA